MVDLPIGPGVRVRIRSEKLKEPNVVQQFTIQRRLNLPLDPSSPSTPTSLDRPDKWEHLGVYQAGESAEFSRTRLGALYRITCENQWGGSLRLSSAALGTHPQKSSLLYVLWDSAWDGTHNDMMIQIDLDKNFDGITGLVPGVPIPTQTTTPPRIPPDIGCGDPEHGRPGHICP